MGFFTSKKKVESKKTPYREDQLQAILDDIQRAGNTPLNFFEGQTYAGFDPRQTEALEGREAYARDQMPGLINPATQAWQSTLNAPDVANNPYVQGMLEQQQRLGNRNLEENILPMLSDQASIQGGVGGYGGSGHRISQGLAARGTQEALLNQAAQTQMNAYGQGLAQQQYGISATPGMMSVGMSPYNELAGVGGAYQGMDQMAINEAMARHQFEQEEPWLRAEREAATYHPLASPYATTEMEATAQASPYSVAAGLGSMALSFFRPVGSVQNPANGPANTPSFGNTGQSNAATYFPPNMGWNAYRGY